MERWPPFAKASEDIQRLLRFAQRRMVGATGIEPVTPTMST